MQDQQQRIVGYFIEEAKDYLTTIEQGLMNLQGTIEDPELMDEVFRAAHSIKGGAGMLEFESIQQAAHRIEDFFKVLKEHPIHIDRELESLFLRAFDTLVELLDHLQGPFGLTTEVGNRVLQDSEPAFNALAERLGLAVHEVDMPSVLHRTLSSQSEDAWAADRTHQVFQQQVPQLLREMLDLFRQGDSPQQRAQLQWMCQRLSDLGKSSRITGWVELLDAASQAIGCPTNSYKTLAPTIIRDLKQAQDLVLDDRSQEICLGSELRALVPQPVAPSPSSLDVDLFDFDDLLNDELAPEITDITHSQGDEFEQDWFTETSNTVVTRMDELDLSPTPSPTQTSRVERPRAEPGTGPEVGVAELDVLADLFRQSSQDLEADLPGQSSESGAGLPLNQAADYDLSDLIFTHEESSADADALTSSLDALGYDLLDEMDTTDSVADMGLESIDDLLSFGDEPSSGNGLLANAVQGSGAIDLIGDDDLDALLDAVETATEVNPIASDDLFDLGLDAEEEPTDLRVVPSGDLTFSTELISDPTAIEPIPNELQKLGDDDPDLTTVIDPALGNLDDLDGNFGSDLGLDLIDGLTGEIAPPELTLDPLPETGAIDDMADLDAWAADLANVDLAHADLDFGNAGLADLADLDVAAAATPEATADRWGDGLDLGDMSPGELPDLAAIDLDDNWSDSAPDLDFNDFNNLSDFSAVDLTDDFNNLSDFSAVDLTDEDLAPTTAMPALVDPSLDDLPALDQFDLDGILNANPLEEVDPFANLLAESPDVMLPDAETSTAENFIQDIDTLLDDPLSAEPAEPVYEAADLSYDVNGAKAIRIDRSTLSSEGLEDLFSDRRTTDLSGLEEDLDLAEAEADLAGANDDAAALWTPENFTEPPILSDLDALLAPAAASAPAPALDDDWAALDDLDFGEATSLEAAADGEAPDFLMGTADWSSPLDLSEPQEAASADRADDFDFGGLGDLNDLSGLGDLGTLGDFGNLGDLGLPVDAVDPLAGSDLEDLDALLGAPPTSEPMMDGLSGLGDLGDLDQLLNQEPGSAPAGDSTLDDLLNALEGSAAPAPASQAASDADELDNLLKNLNLSTTVATNSPDRFEDLFGDAAAPATTPAPAGSTGGLDLDFDALVEILETPAKAAPATGPSPAVSPARSAPTPVANGQREMEAAANRNLRAEQIIKVPVRNLDNLNNLVGEMVVNRNSMEQGQERLRQSLENLTQRVQQLGDVGQRMQDFYERSLLEMSLLSGRRGGSGGGHSDTHHSGESDTHGGRMGLGELELDRFTPFHTQSQEIIELIVRVRESASDIDFVVEQTDQLVRNLRQITTQIQENLNKSRMVTFARTVERLPRAVRSVSERCGKDVDLIIEGKETAIDEFLSQELSSPITHMINNALVHGIETPEARVAAGKPPTGKLTIRAFYQGNQTVISLSDDGAGINTERVKQKAIEKGLIDPNQARNMVRQEIYEMLFLPGFSTKDQADEFGGRGVGMDVVMRKIQELRGSISIDSELGRGTTFTIRLPLNLSICKALRCLSDHATIAFPMDGVEDTPPDIHPEDVQTDKEGRRCIAWRDRILTLHPLTELLKYNRHLSRGNIYGGNQEDDSLAIVVLRSAGEFIAIEVDRVLGEQEIVIKQPEGPVPKPLGIAGMTVLGDGRVMPIADVLELIDLAKGRIRRDTVSGRWESDNIHIVEPPTEQKDPMVLIVDDSITVRELLKMTFQKAGYQVEQARDGQEAWEKLRSGLPCDLVFCDIEMPRMDGLQLLQRLQTEETLCELPVAMLTSRGADKHRKMAVDLGAKGYFTKPYLEEALLDAARRMLRGEVLITANA